MITRIGICLVAFFALSCGSGKVEQDVSLNPEKGKAMEKPEQLEGLVFETEELTQLFEHYLEIQKALAAADPEEVSDKSQGISTLEAGKLNEFASQMSQTDSLPLQQELFSDLTHEIGPKLYDGLKNGRIYKYYCPVSSGKGGGYWYAASRAVANPYAGDEGRSCGTIYEIIRPKKVKWVPSESGR